MTVHAYSSLVRVLFLLCLGLASITFPAASDTIVNTDITADTNWNLAGSPYIVTANISVRSTSSAYGSFVTLTIDPGVVVRFQGGFRLTVGTDEVGYHGGALRALGTVQDSIFFSSQAGEQWGGIRFLNSTKDSRTSLAFCNFRHGSSLGTVQIDDASPSIANSTIALGYGCGILVTGISLPAIYNSVIRNNQGDGLKAEGADAEPVLSSNQFIGNSQHAAALHSAGTGRLSENSAQNNGWNMIALAGDVQVNATWPNTTLPYHLLSTITVKHTDASGSQHALLTIEPGVQVAFGSGVGLAIATESATQYLGALLAVGTESLPIVFTSDESGPKTPGYWKGISFCNGTVESASRLERCVVEYAGHTSGFCVSIDRSSPALVNCDIHHSSQDAVLFTGACEPVVTGCSVHDNARDGLRSSDADAKPAAGNNSIATNAQFGVRLHAAGVSNLGSNNFAGNGDDRIGVSGDISGEVSWPSVGQPYHVLTDVLVKHPSATGGAMARLVVEEGTTLEFSAGTGIEVGADQAAGYLGVLDARGTEALPIVFTSAKPESVEAPGDWKGIRFRNGAVDQATILEHCTVEYAGYVSSPGVGASIRVEDSSPAIGTSLVRHGAGDGVAVDGASEPAINTDTIQASARHGLFSDDSNSQPHVSGSVFLDNVEYAMSLHVTGPAYLGENTATGNGVDRVALTGGAVAQDASWSKSSIPYRVLENTLVQIPSGGTGFVTLTVEPGVTAEFVESAGLEIGPSRAGALMAVGTPGEPITFKAIESPSDAGRAFWKGLSLKSFTNDGATACKHLVLRSGGDAAGANLTVSGAVPVELSFVTMTDSPGWGLKSSQGRILVDHLNLESNAAGGYQHTGTDIAGAAVTWWGDPGGPSGEGPGTIGQAVGANVVYEPWAGEAIRGDFYLTSAAISPTTFNPNGGAVVFRVTPSETANWEIAIRDSAGTIVRTLTGSGSLIEQSWHGDDAGGTPLGDGLYSYTLAAVSQIDPGRTASIVGLLRLRGDIPLAAITSPEAFGFLAGETSVIGTASGANFSHYVLDYGPAEHPLSWTQLAQGTAPVIEGLLATWDLSSFQHPRCTLRLSVFDQVGTASRDSVVVDIVSIFGVTHTAGLFSPNGDGTLDVTRITATVTQEVDWSFVVRDSTAAVRRTITGHGTAIDVTWNGRDDAGQRVADGIYSYQLEAHHAASGLTVLSPQQMVEVDCTLPFLEITSIPEDGYVSGDFDIIGTATDRNFTSYSVAYGAGASPSSWTTLQATTYQPVVNGILAHWNVYSLASGIYTLRVVASDAAGNVKTYTRTVNVDNLRVYSTWVSPLLFDPHLGETCSIHYAVDLDVFVTLRVYSHATHGLVRTLVEESPRAAGTNTEAWDGRGDLGELLPYDVYDYTIYVHDLRPRYGRYDPVYVQGSVTIQNGSVTPGNFDPYAGELARVAYDLVAPAWTTIKIGIPGAYGYADRILIQDTARPRTGNAEYWDGRNNAGQILPAASYVTYGWTKILPDNAIVLRAVDPLDCAVTCLPYVVYPHYGQVSTLTYTLGAAAYVSIEVTGPAGTHVRTLADEELQTIGSHTVTWDAKDDQSKLVEQEGTYRMAVTVRDTTSTSTVTRYGGAVVFR